MTDVNERDYSVLDRPEVLTFIFHPRPEFGTSSGGTAEDLLIPVAEEVVVGARFHPAGDTLPTLLFFHGNGEIVADYDELGPLFTRAGVNFLPVDYRGYGRSTGTPTVSSMMADCHRVLDFIRGWLTARGCLGRLLVAGRSLGSAPALELASAYGYPKIGGLVVESGFARVGPLLQTLGIDPQRFGFREDQGFRNIDKIRDYGGPTLVIHGERDGLIPVANAHALFEASTAEDKRILVIPEADHNSIFMHGIGEYLQAVGELARLGSAQK